MCRPHTNLKFYVMNTLKNAVQLMATWERMEVTGIYSGNQRPIFVAGNHRKLQNNKGELGENTQWRLNIAWNQSNFHTSPSKAGSVTGIPTTVLRRQTAGPPLDLLRRCHECEPETARKAFRSDHFRIVGSTLGRPILRVLRQAPRVPWALRDRWGRGKGVSHQAFPMRNKIQRRPRCM